MGHRNIRLDLTYNGTGYKGWQMQRNAPSVQNELEKAAGKIFHEKIRLIGIGRTDAGAHAFHYVANFKTENFSVPVEKLPMLLSQRLPGDIAVIGSAEVPDSFHSRFSALAREYVYLAVNGYGDWKAPPLFADRAFFLEERLDPEDVRKACRLFAGKHDFRNFCFGYGPDMDFKRKVYYFRVDEIELMGKKVLVFFVKGNGFLRGMIRTMIGVCLNYARGNLTAEAIRKAVKHEEPIDPKFRVPVPACGLYFKRGYYK